MAVGEREEGGTRGGGVGGGEPQLRVQRPRECSGREQKERCESELRTQLAAPTLKLGIPRTSRGLDLKGGIVQVQASTPLPPPPPPPLFPSQPRVPTRTQACQPHPNLTVADRRGRDTPC